MLRQLRSLCVLVLLASCLLDSGCGLLRRTIGAAARVAGRLGAGRAMGGPLRGDVNTGFVPRPGPVRPELPPPPRPTPGPILREPPGFPVPDPEPTLPPSRPIVFDDLGRPTPPRG